jgi:hypothetical protein
VGGWLIALNKQQPPNQYGVTLKKNNYNSPILLYCLLHDQRVSCVVMVVVASARKQTSLHFVLE